MYHELVRIYRSLERRFKDPARNQMSIPRMLWFYFLKRIHALSGQKVLIEVPFAKNSPTESPGRIAVIVHCFYPDLIDELTGYVANIPWPYRLFVSTDTEEKKAVITEKLRARNIPDFEVRLTLNRGRDIAPKYITFRDVYAECDYFIHLHGKKSPHLGEAGGNFWRKYLLHSLLGSPEIVASIFAILKDERIGMVFPDAYNIDLPQLHWTANYEAGVALAKRLGVTISRDHCPEYPAGSMFWAKAAVVTPLIDLNLKFEDFPEEKGQLDGELNHAIERMIVIVAQAQGFQGQRIITEKLRRPRKTLRLETAAQLPEAISECLATEAALAPPQVR